MASERRDNSIRQIGLGILALMPLISLTNMWEVASVSGLSVRASDLLFVFGWFIWGLCIIKYDKLPRAILSFFGLICSLILISIIGIALLPSYQIEWSALVRFIQTIAWGGLALSFVRNKNELKIIARNVIIAGCLLSISSIYLRIVDSHLHRIAGFFSAAGGEGLGRQASYNEIGAIYALSVLLSFLYYQYEGKSYRRWESIVIIISIILNLVGLILVQSRSGFLALALGLVVLIWPEIKRLFVRGVISKVMVKYAQIIIVINTVIIIGFATIAGINRIANTFSVETNEYSSYAMRIIFWRKASETILDSDLFNFMIGYGFRSSARFIGAESAENFFLDICMWLGFLGLIAVALLLIWPIAGMNKKTERFVTGVAIIAFMVIFIVSLFGAIAVDPFYGGSTFLLLYGALAASSKRDDGK
jgi:hypothetical protein